MSELRESINEMRNMRESYNEIAGVVGGITGIEPDITAGKAAIAEAITVKGVHASANDSLSALATKVRNIPQELNTGVSDFEQMITPYPYIWNVYTVATELMQNELPSYIPSYMTEYRARYGTNSFFVGEYYLGYTTLELTGADGYLTCDGDFYTITNGVVTHTSPEGTTESYTAESIVHVWHGLAYNMANRWVAFFYLANAYSFVNNASSICPRRVALSGKCNSFVITGVSRLSDIWVIGTLDHFEGGENSTSCSPNQVICNYKNHTSGSIYNTLSNVQLKSTISSAILPDLEEISSGVIFGTPSLNSNFFYDNLVTVSLPNLIRISYGGRIFEEKGTYSNTYRSLSRIYLPKLQILDNGFVFDTPATNSNRLESLNEITLPRLSTIKNNGAIFRTAYPTQTYNPCSALKKMSLPSLTVIDSGGIIVVTALTPGNNCLNSLLDFEVGELMTSCNMRMWNPTNVLNDTTKKAQLIENIKNHILARVSDATGSTQLVFTVSTNMYNAIASETIELQGETMTLADAFLTKNWLLAGA